MPRRSRPLIARHPYVRGRLPLVGGLVVALSAAVSGYALERPVCSSGQPASCSILMETGAMTTQRCDDDCNGQTIDLAVGQKIEIRLPENPTTGFRWQFTAEDRATCRLESDSFEAPSGPPGRGGEHSWIFEAVRPGDCDIAFRLRRPWDASGEPARTFAIRVHTK